MAARAMLLSGLAAFGLGLFALGALFEEPGGDAPRARRPAPPASAAVSWDAWRLPEPVAPPAESGPALAAAEGSADDPGDESGDAPLPHVWATPARWSEEEE